MSNLVSPSSLYISNRKSIHCWLQPSPTTYRYALLKAAFRESESRTWKATWIDHCRCRIWRRRELRYLESDQLEALVKYSTYHKEKSKKWQTDISKLDNWQHDEEEDTWTCANGQKLVFRYESKDTTESGFEIRHRHYRSVSCEGCPLKPACTKAQGD